MKIQVWATDNAWNELVSNNDNVEWIRSESIASFMNDLQADAYFNLADNAVEMDYSQLKKPVFINCVNSTLKEMDAGENIYRINGWNSFIKRDCWEIAGTINEASSIVLESIKKTFVVLPDEPGFIAARIISMIINEAYFAKAENVSTEKEIDIAMKLGTNYPFGPFEWCTLIGLKNVYALLKKLAESDSRYQPSSLLEQEATQQ